ncbi:MAG: hypothetical protein ACRDGA_00740 [Bacteroidota bacterium]
MTTINENIEVNSEIYFNEKLNYWLNRLTPSDVRLILKKCFQVNTDTVRTDPTICPWDQVDPSYGQSARFDQKIDFGKEFCVILELKVSTEASVGQLEKYLVYLTEMSFKQGYVVLLSRNELAGQKLGYDKLRREHSNLLFVTWNQFESELTQLFKAGLLQSPKQATEHFLYLLSFLTDIRKRSERLIIQPEPTPFDLIGHMRGLVPAAPPKKRGSFLVWQDREHFWNDLLSYLSTHSGFSSFTAFRFDFYEYLVRWAFHIKRVYLDIYEDKNYEYIYNYFITNIYPHKDKLPSALISELYYRFLLVREEEVLSVGSHRVFFRRVGKLWYIYIIDKSFKGTKIPYLRCNQLTFD